MIRSQPFVRTSMPAIRVGGLSDPWPGKCPSFRHKIARSTLRMPTERLTKAVVVRVYDAHPIRPPVKLMP